MTKCINSQENYDDTYAIMVKNGTFHWGKAEEKKDNSDID